MKEIFNIFCIHKYYSNKGADKSSREQGKKECSTIFKGKSCMCNELKAKISPEVPVLTPLRLLLRITIGSLAENIFYLVVWQEAGLLVMWSQARQLWQKQYVLCARTQVSILSVCLKEIQKYTKSFLGGICITDFLLGLFIIKGYQWFT